MGSSILAGSFSVTLGVVVGNETPYRDTIAKAEAADISIIFVNDRLSEGADSNTELRLPRDQDILIAKVANVSKKTIVVLNKNSTILMPRIDQVDSVIEAWYSGQIIGSAIASLLFGDVNPSGKLTVTFPKSFEDLPIFVSGSNSSGDLTEVQYNEGLLVGYKWYDAKKIEPLFPYGHGLSYTTFNLSDMSVERESGNITVSANLMNTREVIGQQVVQLYVSYPIIAEESPKQLKGFMKIEVEAGHTTDVNVTLTGEDLQIWNSTLRDWTLISGHYSFMLGFSATDIVSEGDLFI